MNNVIVLYKNEDGSIYCHELTEKGVKYWESGDEEGWEYWKEGGTIVVLDEIEEILNKER